MADENADIYSIRTIFVTLWFLVSLNTNLGSKFKKIVNGGSNMVDDNVKNYLIGMKFGTRGFLESLTTNPRSTFKNQNQNSESNMVRRITSEKKIHKILKYFAV